MPFTVPTLIDLTVSGKCQEGVWGLLGWLEILPGGLSCRINWWNSNEGTLRYVLIGRFPHSMTLDWTLSALFWGVCRVSVKSQGGVLGWLSDSGYCLAGVVWWGYDVKLIDNKNLIRVILISWFLLSQVPRYVWRLSGMCLSGAWWLSEWIWILSGGYGVQAIDKHPIRHFLLVCSFFPLVALDWSKCAIFWGVWRVSGRCLGGVWGMSEWLWIMPGGIWVECN